MPGTALASSIYSPMAQNMAMQYGLLMSQAARASGETQSSGQDIGESWNKDFTAS